MVQTVFIRRGMDSGAQAGKSHGIFTKRLEFDYFPIPWDVEREDFLYYRTYEQVGCKLGGTLSDYLPARLENEIPHINPHFPTNTYIQGIKKESGGRWKKLTELDTGDLIVFYESLRIFNDLEGYDINNNTPDGLFIIGFFKLECPVITIYPYRNDSLVIQKKFNDEISLIKRRFRGHPLFDYNDAKNWDKIFKWGSIYIAGDSTSGLYDRALEISSFSEKKGNHWPINTFLRERWGLNQSLMRTNALIAKNPEQVEKDITNWMKDPIDSFKDLKESGWNPQFSL